MFGMSKRKPLCGPMTTQPVVNRETIPTQTLPVMPAEGKPRAVAPKKHMTQSAAASSEKALISRRNSLRKQRAAQKTKTAQTKTPQA